MKLLWIKSDFLHPTDRGGRIRTLEMVKRLHARHELHYLAFDDPEQPEGLARAGEYCSKAYPVEHRVPPRGTGAFKLQAVRNLLSDLPLAVERYRSATMRRAIDEAVAREQFDVIVCDFAIPAPNISCLDRCVVFQHNVETMIWRRQADAASGAVAKAYYRSQARRMFEFERRVCREARRVVAVSEEDARLMREMFGLAEVPWVPTGVDTGYFDPAAAPADVPRSDLVFLGSMDWLANIDGVRYFVEEILPLIRRELPEATLAVVGRRPGGAIQELARAHAGVTVTGTVPDVRPYLWGAKLSIVPLRIGGGTRLKIYESMAAGAGVVSTAIGAEGLAIDPPNDIRIADEPERFAAECVALLRDDGARRAVAQAGRRLVAERFSWEQVVRQFESAAGFAE